MERKEKDGSSLVRGSSGQQEVRTEGEKKGKRICPPESLSAVKKVGGGGAERGHL